MPGLSSGKGVELPGRVPTGSARGGASAAFSLLGEPPAGGTEVEVPCAVTTPGADEIGGGTARIVIAISGTSIACEPVDTVTAARVRPCCDWGARETPPPISATAGMVAESLRQSTELVTDGPLFDIQITQTHLRCGRQRPLPSTDSLGTTTSF